MVRGPMWGYFSKLANIILVVSPQNIPRLEAFFRGYGVKIVMGSRYLEGFVGAEASQALWLD